MSLLATPFAFLFFFSGFAVAQVITPGCDLTWAWSFNSLNQDPCEVAAFMLRTCTVGTYTIVSLPPGNSYAGPSGVDVSNLCKCSTVGYSLMSACGGCQGGKWITWSEYSSNCTKTLPPSLFPNPVPSGIRVPHWALLDVTNGNVWDFNKSYAAGDSPELAPGSVPGPSSTPSSTSSTSSIPSSTSSTPSSTSSTPSSTSSIPSSTPSSTSSSPSSPSSIRSSTSSPPSSPSTTGLKVGLIASGIVGGIAAITLLVAALFFYRRWRYSLTSSATPPAPESGGDNLSTVFAFNTPMLSHIPSRASSNRNLYTVSPMSPSQPHG